MIEPSPRDKPVVLLLPGMMCDGALWQPQLDGLGAIADFRIADFSACDSIAAMASRALELVGHQQRFAIVGLSMGGIVAMELWRRVPDRIMGLALLDSNHRADTSERKAVRRRQIDFARRGGLYWLLRDELKPAYRTPQREPSPALLDTVMAMGLRLGPINFIAQSVALEGRCDSESTLKTITCPALVMCGQDDALCPPERHQEMAELIKSSELVVIPECGHLSTLEKPAFVNAALANWLPRIASATSPITEQLVG